MEFVLNTRAPRKRLSLTSRLWPLAPQMCRAVALRAVTFSALALAIAAFACPVLLAVSTPVLARNDAAEEAKRMQQETREMQKRAEEQRREAAKEAKRLEQEARRQQKEAEQRQKEAAKQAREAERASKAAAASRPASNGSQTSNTSKSSNSSPANSKSETASKKQTDDDSNSKKADAKTADKKKDEKPDEKDSKDSKDSKDESADIEIDEGPPATVAKWLEKLAGPSKPAVASPAKPIGKPTETAKPAAAQDAAKAAPATPQPVKPTPAKAAAGGRGEPIVFPEFKSEVLAVNATRQTLEKAKALGFKSNAATTLLNLDFAVTRLQAPQGMSAADAKALLARELPASSFALNQKYRIYKTAGNSLGHPASKTIPAGARAAQTGSAAQSCDVDRCFGRDVIGWRPELRRCASGVKIGVIDTAVDVSHPAFAKKKLDVKHLGREGAPGPNWHGTGVAALLAGDASSGTPGLIPDANFYIADIFSADADNEPASDTVSMLRAFDWLESKGVKIINMSLSGPPDDLIRKAIERLASKGVLMVAAAGNEGPAAGPSYPAAYEQVIAVTAVNKDLQSYRYANRGSYIDIAAPGVSIWTALPGSMEGYHSGTSFAAPYVTATLAAIYPRLASKSQAEALRHFSFKDLGAPGPDPIFGNGLVVAPASCSGDEIASTPSASTIVPSSAAAASTRGSTQAGEQLPWLSFQGADR